MKNLSLTNKHEQELYKSQDFYLSAICLAAGLNLIRLERNTSKFVTFVFFDPKHEASEIISNHWSRKFKIPSRDIIESINELKTRMYNGV